MPRDRSQGLADPRRPASEPRTLRPFRFSLTYSPEMVDIGWAGDVVRPCASVWIGMNFLMLDPQTALVEERQLPLMRLLGRHVRTLGGGAHCVTLDLRRRGGLESYTG
jgi:hypothetical protein